MTIAVIVAGGVGNRMGQSIPKQFINVYDKPISRWFVLKGGKIQFGRMRSITTSQN